jgi:hypothetical protein
MGARQRLVHLSDPQCEEHIEFAHQQMGEAPANELRMGLAEGSIHMGWRSLGTVIMSLLPSARSSAVRRRQPVGNAYQENIGEKAANKVW